jgi:hypothetical protein
LLATVTAAATLPDPQRWSIGDPPVGGVIRRHSLSFGSFGVSVKTRAAVVEVTGTVAVKDFVGVVRSDPDSNVCHVAVSRKFCNRPPKNSGRSPASSSLLR